MVQKTNATWLSDVIGTIDDDGELTAAELRTILRDLRDSVAFAPVSNTMTGGRLLQVTEGENNLMSLTPSPLRQLANEKVFVDGTFRTESTGLELGPGMTLNSLNSYLGLTNAQMPNTQFMLVDYMQRRTGSSTRPRTFHLTAAESDIPIFTGTGTLTGTEITFDFPITTDGQTNAVLFEAISQMTNVRFRVRHGNAPNTDIRFWPSEQAWDAGTGNTIEAGNQVLDFGASQLRTFANLGNTNPADEIEITIRADALNLRGDPATNEPAIAVRFQPGEFRDLAYLADLDANFRKLARRSTSLTINSSNVTTYQPSSFIEFTNDTGQVDLTIADGAFTIGDELIVKHYSASNTAGAQVRIVQQGTGGRIDGELDVILTMDAAMHIKYVALNTWRIISDEASITRAAVEGVQDTIGGMVTGNTESGIAVTYNDTTGKLNFDVPATGVTSATQALLSGNVLQTQLQLPAPASPITLNTDLSSIAGTGTGTLTGGGTSGQIATWSGSTSLSGVDRIAVNQIAFAQAAGIPAGAVEDINTEAKYNARRNAESTTVVQSSSTTVLRLPRLATRPSWMRTGDIFIYTNSDLSTRSIVLQTGAVSDLIPGSDTGQNNTTLDIAAGQSVAVRVPASGRTWERVAYTSTSSGAGDVSGSGAAMHSGGSPNPFLAVPNWTYTINDNLSHNGNVLVDNTFELSQTTIGANLTATSASGPTFSLTFSNDQAMVEWFRDILPAQGELDLGSTAQDVQDSLASGEAKGWINTNVVVSYNFELINRASALTVTAASLESPNHVRLGLSGPTNAFYMDAGRTVRISGASDGRLNGDFVITQRLTSHIVIAVPGVTTTDIASNTGGTAHQLWYASVAPSVDVTGRLIPFYLFLDAGRTQTADASVATHQFDLTGAHTEFSEVYGTPVYSPSTLEVSGKIQGVDGDGLKFPVRTGSKDTTLIVDNTGANVEFRRYIPTNVRNYFIKAQALTEMWLDFDPADLADGESRHYTVHADHGTTLSGFGYYALSVGRHSANPLGGVTRALDNGMSVIYVPPGGHVELMFYKTGSITGIRLVSPLERSREVNPAYQTSTVLTGTIANKLPFSHANRNLNTDEDPFGLLIGLDNETGVSANTVRMEAGIEYDLEYEVTLQFAGAEGTGLLFLPVNLTPYVNSTAQIRGRDTATLLFSRNGESGSGAPMFEVTLTSRIRHHATANDTVSWSLGYGTFPAGYSVADIRVLNASGRVTAMANLK